MARFIPQRPSILLLLASCYQERRGAEPNHTIASVWGTSPSAPSEGGTYPIVRRTVASFDFNDPGNIPSIR
jgi:hypothetical protein